MSYTESLLASGERMVRVAHQHWFIMVWRARWAVLGLVIAIALTILRAISSDTDGLLWTLLGWATLILLLIGLGMLGWGALQYRAEEYVITSRRILHVDGVINKRATDSSLEKINDAILIETIFGRLFGFGDLDVLTASEAGIEKLRMLRDAKEFKKAMLEAKHELEIELNRPTMPPVRSSDAGPASAPAAPAPEPKTDTADEVANALERLGDLRDRGILTPEEFAAKKAELLSRL
jgi:uncharacterized membrane protein YdbT with pleckstrin-like domain